MEMHDNTEVIPLIFTYLAAKCLARALCVCKLWKRIGEDECLWKALCLGRWPSTGLEASAMIVRRVGGYRKLYSLRARGVDIPAKPKVRPWLKLKYMTFFVDISYKGRPVLSRVLDKMHTVMENSWFEINLPVDGFCTDIVPVDELVQNYDSNGEYGYADEDAIRLQYLLDLEVNWTAVRSKDQKMVCLLSGHPSGGAGTLCFPEDEDDRYKVEFEQPLALGGKANSILQICEGELSSYGNLSVELLFSSTQKKTACLKLHELQLGIRTGFDDFSSRGKVLYCLQLLQWK